MAQMKEQIKTPEKELNDVQIDNPSGAEFKILVIRMLTELIELSHKMKEEMKATNSEIQENMQGANSEGKETGTQINGLDQKEGRNKTFNQNRMKKQEFKKMRRGLGTSATTLGIPISESWGCWKQEEQDIENLFE